MAMLVELPPQQGPSKRELLDGFPAPAASPSAIVACIRRGEAGALFHKLLLPWDSSLSLPQQYRSGLQPPELAGTQEDVSTRGRAAKRARRSEPHPQGVQQPQQQDSRPAGAASSPEAVQVDAERLAPLTSSHVVPVSDSSLAAPTAVQLPQLVTEPPKAQLPSKEEQEVPIATAAGAGPGSGGSNSVEGTQGTTQTGFHLPDSNNPSPTEVDAWHQQHEQEQRQEHQPSTEAAPSHVLIPPPRFPSGTSVGVQAGGGVLLPPSLLALRGANEAMSAPFSTVSPHDLLLRGAPFNSSATTAQLLSPDHSASGLCTASQGLSNTGPQGSAPAVNDKVVEGLIAAAQARKRKADAERGSGPWTIPTISLYVESCLMFVDACVTKMAVPPRSPEDRNARALAAADLYQQTARLLQHTARVAESVRAPDAARDALRVLCERLAAVCLMREASLSQQRFRDHAARVDGLLEKSRQGLIAAEQQRPVPVATQQPVVVAAAGKGQQEPSPVGSTNSSQDQLLPAGLSGAGVPRANAGLQVNVAAELGPLQNSLLGAARTISQFAELLRRSTLGFQALLERADVRESQPAKLACMHMAMLCMDIGMGDGPHMCAHARATLDSIRKMDAASRS